MLLNILTGFLFLGIVSANTIQSRSAEGILNQVFIACSSTNSRFDFGAGIVLTQKYVLTVASLIKGFDSWRIGYGANQIGKLSYAQSSNAFIHPNYNAANEDNSIGILVMDTLLPINAITGLAMPTFDIAIPRAYQSGSLVGFGVTENSDKIAPLQAWKLVYPEVVPDALCHSQTRRFNTTSSFCAYDNHPNSKKICEGDKGNALAISYRGVWVLAGLATTVSQKCVANEITAFVRVETYIPWIRAVTGLLC